METGLILLTGGATITKLMDLIGNQIPEKYRKLIPRIAMLLWVIRMFLSPEQELHEIISQWISMWLWAVGIHVITKKEKPTIIEAIKENNSLSTNDKDEPYTI